LSFHDNQITLTKISLALSSGRDNHPPAATAEMAILIVAVFSSRLSRYTCECTDKSVPFGKYCLSRPLVFSFDPRCHGLCGSQK
jgi:hypothetical protein